MTTGIEYKRRTVALALIRRMDMSRELAHAGIPLTTEDMAATRALCNEWDRLRLLRRLRSQKLRPEYRLEGRRNDRAYDGAAGYAGRASASARSARVLEASNGGGK